MPKNLRDYLQTTRKKMALRHATFYPSAIINGTTITGSYQTALVLPQDIDCLALGSTCNKNLLIRVPSMPDSGVVETKEVVLLARQTLVLDFRSLSKRLAAGLVEYKHAGSPPTEGDLAFIALN